MKITGMRRYIFHLWLSHQSEDNLYNRITKDGDEIERLSKKSEILEENNKLLIQQKSQLYEDLDVAYDRIDKAIEYIERYITEQGETLPYYNYQKVICILKGEQND